MISATIENSTELGEKGCRGYMVRDRGTSFLGNDRAVPLMGCVEQWRLL
jgi:hypothetical protein